MALMVVFIHGFLAHVILFDSIFEAHEEANRWGGACGPEVIRFEITAVD